MAIHALDVAMDRGFAPEAHERMCSPLPRVLVVIPESSDSTFIFARRQVASLQESGATVQPFFLGNRQSLSALIAESELTPSHSLAVSSRRSNSSPSMPWTMRPYIWMKRR